MLNIVAVNGRLTEDVKVHVINDTKVANFSVAVQKNFKNKDGKYECSFFPVTLWGSAVDYLEQHSGKGAMVSVSGELNSRIYTKNDGTTATVIEIFAKNVSVLTPPHTQMQNNTVSNNPNDMPEHKETVGMPTVSNNSPITESTATPSQSSNGDKFEPVNQDQTMQQTYDPFDI